jgi:hypothetical protein
LRDFLGGEDVLQRALDIFRSATDTVRKEVELRDLYVASLQQQAGARFILPFRFQAKGKARTSHYLIHCSSSPLAFKIMKGVMLRTATEGGDSGVFEFLESTELGAQTSLFRPALDRARQEILDELRRGQRPVRFFTEEWVQRPTDFLVDKQYKDLLLALELDELIEVLDQTTGKPKPASRRMRSGKPTLADNLLVRVRPLVTYNRSE